MFLSIDRHGIINPTIEYKAATIPVQRNQIPRIAKLENETSFFARNPGSGKKQSRRRLIQFKRCEECAKWKMRCALLRRPEEPDRIGADAVVAIPVGVMKQTHNA